MRDRDDSLRLLRQYTKSDSLLKHALAVEVVMRAMAEKFEGDVEDWATAGLLHDFDYEAFPDEHPLKGAEILREYGYDEGIVHAILGHASVPGCPRRRAMDKALFAVDELTGFVMACALVQPGKSIQTLNVKSVKKKLKTKSFAKKVNRAEVSQGAEDLGWPLDKLIHFILDVLRRNEDELGLAPSPSTQKTAT